MRILIVEDEILVSMMLEDMLLDLGHEITHTINVAEAASAIGTEEPQCAILDVNLGKETSYPIADDLRARKIPFAFATGFGRDGVDARYRDVPIIPKPFTEVKVVDVLKGLVDYQP